MNLTRTNGFLHWVFPAMLVLVAASTLLSGRDLSQTFIELRGDTVRGPMIVWGQRLVSLLLVLACIERVISHIAARSHLPSPMLTLVFCLYWIATVAAPAVCPRDGGSWTPHGVYRRHLCHPSGAPWT